MIHTIPKRRQTIIPELQPRRLASGQSPISRTNTPLTWRVRQYVDDQGASYEPLLADMTTESDIDYHIQSYKGFISDNDQEQYVHKFYSVRIVADQAVTIPIQIFWPKNLAIVSSTGGVDTVEYTTGTDDNVVERLTVDLALGVNELHILTYTGVVDQRLEIVLDLTSIHSSMTVVDPIIAGGVFREVATGNIFGPTGAGRDALSGDYNFCVIDGAGASITSGDDCNFIGRDAGGNSTGSSDSNAFGPLAGGNWTSASRNNAMGANAARGDAGGCTAADVNAFGRNTGLSLTSGHDLNLFGNGAGDAITNGTHLNLFGDGAGTKITTSDHINAMGSFVLFDLVSGGNHNVFGQTGFQNAVTGSHLNGLGNNVGAKCNGDSSNVLCLGSSAGPFTLGVYNQEVYIDNHSSDTPLFHMDTTGHAVTINGDFDVTGTLTKGAGAFKITHPLNPKQVLIHGFVEGPEYGLRYRGKVKLENGKAKVDIDVESEMILGTFEAIAANCTVYLQNVTGFTNIRPRLKGAILEIIAEAAVNDEVDWMVCAERCDPFVMSAKSTDDRGHLILEREHYGNAAKAA